MVGAITFIENWIAICRENRCNDCELHRRGVCLNSIREMDNARIRKAIQTVAVINAQKKQKEVDE